MTFADGAATEVNVCATTTFTVDVVDCPAPSAIRTCNVYVPAAANVAVVVFAAFVPLTENTTAPGGLLIADQV